MYNRAPLAPIYTSLGATEPIHPALRATPQLRNLDQPAHRVRRSLGVAEGFRTETQMPARSPRDADEHWPAFLRPKGTLDLV